MAHHLLKNPYFIETSFEKFYPNQAHWIKDFWMPNKQWKGCNVNDPSARVLGNYGDSGK